jgi:hypothetical protein
VTLQKWQTDALLRWPVPAAIAGPDLASRIEFLVDDFALTRLHIEADEQLGHAGEERDDPIPF